MNTKQLVALWYAMVVLLSSLVAEGWGIKWLRTNGPATLAIGAIIFGGIVIFTLKSSNQFDKKLFFKWMSIPAILLVTLFTLILYQENRGFEVLPPSEIAKVTGEAKGYSSGNLYVNLHNGSNYSLRNIVFSLTAKERNGNIRWARQFQEKIYVSPLSSGLVSSHIFDNEGTELDMHIDEIKGVNQER